MATSDFDSTVPEDPVSMDHLDGTCSKIVLIIDSLIACDEGSFMNPIARTELESIRDSAMSFDLAELKVWANRDLEALFGEDFVFKVKRRRFHALRGITGGLVFLPILWTWLCLSMASSAFVAWTQAHERSSRSAIPAFLNLWHSGFNGMLNRWFWFDRFTQGALIISVVVMLALILDAGWEDGTRETHDRAYSRHLADLKSSLSIFDTSDALNTEALLNEGLASFGSLLSQIESLALQMKLATQDLVDASASIHHGANVLASGVDVLDRTSRDMPSSIEQVTDSLRIGMEELRDMNGVDRNSTVILVDALSQMIPNLKAVDEKVGQALEQQAIRLDELVRRDLEARKSMDQKLPEIMRFLEALTRKAQR